MNYTELHVCKGCAGHFERLDSEGYCCGCAYERDTKLDNLTGGDHE